MPGALAAAVDAGARILTATPAFGVFDGPLVAAASRSALYRIRPRHLVFATGAVEQSAVFPNNDLPGIMLSSAVERLIETYRVLPGVRAVVLTSGDEGYRSARLLWDAGAEVTVVDLRSADALPAIDGIRSLPGQTILAAHGRRRVKGVTVGTPGSSHGQQDRVRSGRVVGVRHAVDQPARDDGG